MDKIRAWKDSDYRSALSQSELATLDWPVPAVDLDNPALGRVNDGRKDTPISWCLPHFCYARNPLT